MAGNRQTHARPEKPVNVTASSRPRVAVVIPAYKQPGLLGEAIASVLRQEEAARAVAIVVDDGCPMPETRDVALSFARAHAGRVFVIRRANGGLSAARNTGIDFALSAWPELEGVMFLDADNRIEKRFLVRALAALEAAAPEIGWVYPDIDMIGWAENWSMRGEFSWLALLDSNYCDAGSVVRRAVLQEGLRFDETLRMGFEDWDFWLQAAQAGYRGQHLPNAGFRYRRRGESMVAAARRRSEIILSQMHQKRRSLLLPRRLRELEAKEAPRFLILHPSEDCARFTHDPALGGRSVPLTQTVRRLRSFQISPAALHVPPVICCASRRSLSLLADALVLATVFWRVQILAREKKIVRIVIRFGPTPEARLDALPVGAPTNPAHGAALIFLRTRDLPSAESGPRQAVSWAQSLDPEAVATIEIQLPDSLAGAEEASDNNAEEALTQLLDEMSCQSAAPVRTWRRDDRPPRNDLMGLYERLCMVGPPLPITRPAQSRGEIGFLIPIHAFGGVEKVIANQAKALRARGYRPHLFLSRGASFLLGQETRDAFVSINPLFCPEFDRDAAGYDYFGAAMSGFERGGDAVAKRDTLGLLSCMDVVINTHSLGGHGLASRLRELGVRTMVALHLVEQDEIGAPIGNPHMALAYEHSYERFLVVSRELGDWCVAHGVPEQKILLLPNAPSYSPRDTAQSVIASRSARAPGPLRALFLGRLDAQKGLDRLAALIEATKEDGFEWRVIGKPVVLDSNNAIIEIGVALESPLHDPALLDAAYDWADVLVAPSRFEGAPLTLLEARRRGVTIIATRVGAVEEVMPNGGFLIDAAQDEAGILASFLDALRALASDAALLLSQAQIAARSPIVSWEQSLEPLLRALDDPQTPNLSSPSMGEN